MPDLTTSQAAALLNVTNSHIRWMLRSGTLRGRKTGRDWTITPKAVEAARNRKTKPGKAKSK